MPTMKQIEEDNKNLIALRNNYFTMLFLTTGSVVGISLSDMNTSWQLCIMAAGGYFILVSIYQIRILTSKIQNNIRRMTK